MKMILRPIYDNVVVKREAAAAMTKGGLHVPETGRDAPARGEILAVGEGEPLADGSNRKVPVRVGDRVLFRKYAATDTRLADNGEGEEVTLVRIVDIIGVIVPDTVPDIADAVGRRPH